MDVSSLNSFLTTYIGSLYERTRSEKTGLKLGFDWIIYRLALARDWLPVRLPFYPRTDEQVSKPKSEPEFGIDFAFLLPSAKELWVYVLKDEELTYANWTKYDFDTDLRMAATPDLRRHNVTDVQTVKIILAYNKGENDSGVKAFENLVGSLGSQIGGNVHREFERWNLFRIVEEVKKDLLKPDLLPQHLSEHFRYICRQIQEFDFGTEAWENQLVTNWKSFLKILLSSPDERKVRLVPVVLLIANNFRKNAANSRVGWTDLVEWAMLALWDCCKDACDEQIEQIVLQTWIQFYIFQLDLYFAEVKDVLLTYHGFATSPRGAGHQITQINDAYMALWHLGRLGILTLAPQEIKPGIDKDLNQAIRRAADWLASCFRLNPAALRPLVDLNHIELFLVWLILWQARRENEISDWLSELEQRLVLRRVNEKSVFPFIESNSRMDLLTEYAATGERPDDYSDSSSYLLLMLIELACALPEDARDTLTERYVNRLVHGIGDDGKRLVDRQIDLMSWVPPDDWARRILHEPVEDGIAITTDNFASTGGDDALSSSQDIITQIESLVRSTRRQFRWKLPTDIPQSVYILACIKNHSPLPPEFWRSLIFPEVSAPGKQDGGDAGA